MSKGNISNEAVIQLVSLTKVFKDFWNRSKVVAVDDLSLTIQRGEVFGFLGPNGSGKTTTIRLMLGLLFPTRGLARVLGLPPHHVAVKRRIGYLPEESYLYQYLTAEEALDFYGRLFDIPSGERHRRIDNLLDLVGLVGARKRPIKEYSKGMARRLGLAQALINDPELLILDEPTAGLDPVGTREVKDLIRSLKQRGKTVFLSSHLLADVEDACDRIAILYGGRLRMEGSVSELLAQNDMTQIRTPRLAQNTLTKLREMICEMEGDQPVEIATPKQSLEGLFLSVVAQARQEKVLTAGAEAGKISGFLADEDRAAEPEDVLSALLSEDREEPAETAVEDASIAPAETASIVEELVQETPKDEEIRDPEPEQEPLEEDSSVIEDLMRDEESS